MKSHGGSVWRTKLISLHRLGQMDYFNSIFFILLQFPSKTFSLNKYSFFDCYCCEQSFKLFEHTTTFKVPHFLTKKKIKIFIAALNPRTHSKAPNCKKRCQICVSLILLSEHISICYQRQQRGTLVTLSKALFSSQASLGQQQYSLMVVNFFRFFSSNCENSKHNYIWPNSSLFMQNIVCFDNFNIQYFGMTVMPFLCRDPFLYQNIIPQKCKHGRVLANFLFFFLSKNKFAFV